MSLPDLPPFYDMKYTEEDGSMTRDSKVFNDQTFQTLNALVILVNSFVSSVINQGATPNVVNNGINPPSFTSAEITQLQIDFPNLPNGTLWYDSTLKKLRFKADTGVIETITSV